MNNFNRKLKQSLKIIEKLLIIFEHPTTKFPTGEFIYSERLFALNISIGKGDFSFLSS